MHAIKVLHKLLATAVPSIHKTRLKSFIASIESVACGAAVNVTAIGRGLTGSAYDKHKIKRADRLLSNPHLYLERNDIYKALTHRLLSGITHPIIIIDWSPLCADLSQQLLRASIPVKGRSLTLYEEIHPAKKLGNRKVQHQFMDHLALLLPQGTVPTIVADSGFRTPFYRYVEDHFGWHWVGRIRGRDFLCVDNTGEQWISVKSLFDKATTRVKRLGLVQWVRNKPLRAHVAIIRQPRKYRKKLTVRGEKSRSKHNAVHSKRNKEPWVIVYSCSLAHRRCADIVGIYKKRMQIEQGFRDSKSARYGLGVCTWCRVNVKRRAILCLIASCVLWLLWCVGTMMSTTDKARQLRVNSSSPRAPYSVIFLARLLLRRQSISLNQTQLKTVLTQAATSFDLCKN